MQRVVNDFNRNKLLLDNFIFLFVCLFVGAFSGKFGFKTTIILSLTSKSLLSIQVSCVKNRSLFSGELLKDAVDFTNYAYFDFLPIEFLYIDSLSNITGGAVTYYLAAYGLVTRFNQKSRWATRLAAFDGVESATTLIGTLLAPLIFEKVLSGRHGKKAIFPIWHILS